MKATPNTSDQAAAPVARKITAFLQPRLALRTPTVVLVGGGTGSGKSSTTRIVLEFINQAAGRPITILKQDWYWKETQQRPSRRGGALDLDHFDGINWEWLEHDLGLLLNGQVVDHPHYRDLPDGREEAPRHSGETTQLHLDGGVLVVEGLYVLTDRLLSACKNVHTIKVWIDASREVRFLRRIWRETTYYRKPLRHALRELPLLVESENEHVLPQHARADAVFKSHYPGGLAQMRCLLPALAMATDEPWADPLLATLKEDGACILSIEGARRRSYLDPALDRACPEVQGVFTSSSLNACSLTALKESPWTTMQLHELGHCLIELRQSYPDDVPAVLDLHCQEYYRLLRDSLDAHSLDEAAGARTVRWLSKHHFPDSTVDPRVTEHLLQMFSHGWTWRNKFLLLNALRMHTATADTTLLSSEDGYRLGVPCSANWQLQDQEAVLAFTAEILAPALALRANLLGSRLVRVSGSAADALLNRVQAEALRRKTAGQESVATIWQLAVEVSAPCEIDLPVPPDFSECADRYWRLARQRWLPGSVRTVHMVTDSGLGLTKYHFANRAPRRNEWRRRECLFCSNEEDVLESGTDLAMYGLPYRIAANKYPYFSPHVMAIHLGHGSSTLSSEITGDLLILSRLLQANIFVSEVGASHDEHLHIHATKTELWPECRGEQQLAYERDVSVSSLIGYPAVGLVVRGRSAAAMVAGMEMMRLTFRLLGYDVSVAIVNTPSELRAIMFPRIAAAAPSTGIRLGTNEVLGHFVLDDAQLDKFTAKDLEQSIREVVAPLEVLDEVLSRWCRNMEAVA